MRVLVDTSVFSAALSRNRRGRLETQVRSLAGNQLFLAAVTVSELRYGALVAEWGSTRSDGLEQAIAATTVVPVSDALLAEAAQLRHACRQVGHALADRAHANDLWIAASAMHIDAPLVTADSIFTDTPRLTLLA